MAYNCCVVGCSGDGVSKPVPLRLRKEFECADAGRVLSDEKLKTPDANWVRRVAIYINKHTIQRIVSNLLTVK